MADRLGRAIHAQGVPLQHPDNDPNNKQGQEFLDFLGDSKTTSATKGDSEDDQGSESGYTGRAKPVLTEEQKKANHIYSEQKRREKIREQYDKLADLTPGMAGQGRSEARVLEEAVRYGHALKDERAKLIAAIEAQGGVVPEDLKKY